MGERQFPSSLTVEHGLSLLKKRNRDEIHFWHLSSVQRPSVAFKVIDN